MSEQEKREGGQVVDVSAPVDADQPTGPERALESQVEDSHNESEGNMEGARDGDKNGTAPTGLGLNDVQLQPSGSVERGTESPPTLLPKPPLSPHPADDLHAPDSPTTSLISVLREQLRLLSDQSQQLNTKLVSSISKHADLLDAHDALQAQHSDLESRAVVLEREKRHWEESMKTGLLVERSQITLEMQKLASGLVEEERRRGSAEERRRKVEDEVDELAASLFDQANTMVAAERHGRIEAETRLKSTEDNLAAAEAAMRDMQVHLQNMPTHTPPGSDANTVTTVPRRFLSSHVPFTEFLSFLSHLRSLRPLKETSKALFPAPLLSALISQPFLARTVVEDHDPTIRLDAAPDLSWLSRRGVSSAIISGDLIIEPVPATTVLQATSSMSYEIGCALCGKPVFPGLVPQSPTTTTHFGPPPQHPGRATTSGGRFSLKPFFNTTASPSTAPSPTSSPLASPAPGQTYSQSSQAQSQSQGQSQPPSASLPAVYIFRVAKPATGSTGEKEKEAKSYPLCRSGWCLERLRATCALWHFIKSGMVAVVWAGDDGFVLPSEGQGHGRLSIERRDSGIVTVKGSEAPQDGVKSDEGQADVSTNEADGPKRKSGWGLGFRGWKSGANSGSAGTASPPVSPRLPTASERTVSGSTLDGRGEKGLGAPLELADKEKEGDGLKDTLAPPLPPRRGAENDQTATPSVKLSSPETSERQSQETPREPGGEAHRPAISRQASDISFASAHETLNSSPNERVADPGVLPSVAAVDEAAEEDAQGEKEAVTESTENSAGAEDDQKQEEQVVDLSSPVARTEPGVPGTPVTGTDNEDQSTPVAAAAPPPIPRRAAGRPKSIRVADSGAPSPIISGRASPVTAEPEVETDKTTESAEGAEGVGETKDNRPAPPLPARPPKTPTMNKPSVGTLALPQDGEKAFLPIPSAKEEDESGKEDALDKVKGEVESETWEARTWKQVIGLKEAMWRARVGVDDGDQ